MNMTADLAACLPLYCEIVQERLYQSEIGEYNTYGIRITAPAYSEMLHDVSVCKKTSERIAGLLKRNGISVVHLHEVVGDLLP